MRAMGLNGQYARANKFLKPIGVRSVVKASHTKQYRAAKKGRGGKHLPSHRRRPIFLRYFISCRTNDMEAIKLDNVDTCDGKSFEAFDKGRKPFYSCITYLSRRLSKASLYPEIIRIISPENTRRYIPSRVWLTALAFLLSAY